MGEALQNTHRPIVYSLWEYGEADVWKWGVKTGGNLWPPREYLGRMGIDGAYWLLTRLRLLPTPIGGSGTTRTA